MEAALLLAGVLLFLAGGCGIAYAADGFSVELIHRDSIKSPFHDPKLTRHDRFLAAARRSRARAAKLLLARPGSDVSSDLFYGDFEYLAAVNVGTPPVRFLAVADTGSDLVWLKCNTKQNNNGIVSSGSGNNNNSPPPPPPEAVVYFNPFDSSTYSRVGCDGPSCLALATNATCNADSHACDFRYSYGDGSSATGLLAADTFTFGGSINNNTTSTASIDFGCATGTAGREFQADGVVGLGASPFSLASQLGRKFSFCLTSYDIDDASSTLNFGARAVVSDPGAATTPLVASDSDAGAYYAISVDSLKVAGQPVAGTTSVSKVIVDTGTVLTFLDRAALLAPLSESLARVMDGKGLPRAPPPDETLELCYDVSRVKDVDDVIPDVTLVLAGGGEVRLTGEGTFVLVKEGVLCLAVVATSPELQPLSVLGNVALQDLHVGIDLDARTATFATANCDTSSRPR